MKQPLPASLSSRRRHGFTLVELLVVIAIISILIALVMPAVSRVREISRQAVCLSNLRQIGTAQMAYVFDNQGEFPPCFLTNVDPGTVNFATEGVFNGQYPNPLGCILPYVSYNRKIYTCPEGVYSDYCYGFPSAFGGPIDLTAMTNYMPNGIVFATNWPMFGSYVTPSIRVTKLHNSSDLIMFQEWLIFANSCWPRPFPWYGTSIYSAWHANNGPSAPGDWSEEYSNIHSHGGNLCFADGHAEWRSYKSLRAGDFGLTGGPGVSGQASDGWQAGELTYLRAP